MKAGDKQMNRFLVSTVLVAAGGLAFAKLPPPDDATKAKAAETTAKAAWQAKVDAYQLCKAQDKMVAQYMKTSGKTAAKPAAPAAAPPAAAASGTPVAAAAPLPPCADPGPFAYNPPEQKPLEAAGAHSPSGTAASPPSVKPPSAEMAPAKK
jgi:hypothetical protein